MIYVHRGKFNTSIPNEEARKAVIEGMGVKYHDLTSRLPELVGSFIKSIPTENGNAWAFEHPTISDAMTDILSLQPNMIEALMRGAPVKTIMLNFVCKDVAELPNVAIIPVQLEQVLTERLDTVPNEQEANRILFNFLATRASENIIKSMFEAKPDILDRYCWHYGDADFDPKNRLAARAHELGVLSEDDRYFISDDLKRAAMERFDLSFLTSKSLLALIQPTDLLALGMKLKSKIINDMESMLDEIQDSADIDDDPETQFERVKTGLGIMEEICKMGTGDDQVYADAYAAIETKIEILNEKQEEHREDEEWDFHSASKTDAPTVDNKATSETDRSIFYDLDK